jgi:hypothetical protein
MFLPKLILSDIPGKRVKTLHLRSNEEVKVDLIVAYL